MEREVVWAQWNGEALEHLRLTVDAAGIAADGVIVGVEDDGQPFRLRYRVRCDPGWRVREVDVDPLRPGASSIALRADGAGRWTTAAWTSTSGSRLSPTPCRSAASPRARARRANSPSPTSRRRGWR